LDSPLHQFIVWTLSLASSVGIPLLGLHPLFAPSLVLFFCYRFLYHLFVLLVCSGYSVLCSCCGVWKTVSTVFVTTLVPGYCIDMVSIVLWLHLGLCVTGLLILRQPQRPMVVPLVYDEECLRWGLPETCCILLIFLCSSFSCTLMTYCI